MVLNLWSILLIASASQCVFLIVLFSLRPPSNRKGLFFLMLMIFVLLAINVNNLWYAGYLYRNNLGIAGFARGMILLLGPLFYLYTLSIIRSDFRIKWAQLLHLIPFIIAWVMISSQNSGDSRAEAVVLLDKFMSGTLPLSTLSILRFVLYAIHLTIYVLLSRREMIKSLNTQGKIFLVSNELRISWLVKVNGLLILVLAQQVIFNSYMIYTGYYTIFGNFVLTLLISGFVYLIAYQTIFNANQLLPDFSSKYGSVKVDDAKRKELLTRLDQAFNQEKMFKNSELKIQDVAQELGTSSHVLSTLINTSRNMSFFELLNHYRIEEFKAIAHHQAYSNYSIMGIANEVGYKSKSSFNTAFKKHTGQTPSDYLKNRS